jgi:hypothetical protein
LRFKNNFYKAQVKTIARQIIQVEPQIEDILLESTTTLDITEIIQQTIQPTIIQPLNLNSAIKSTPKILLNKYKPKMTDTGVANTISSQNNTQTNKIKLNKSGLIILSDEELDKCLNINSCANNTPSYGDSNFQCSSSYIPPPSKNIPVQTVTIKDQAKFNKFEQFYNGSNFVHGSCGIRWDIQKNSKVTYDMPTGETKKLTTKRWNPNHTAAYIIPELSGILPIDIDHEELCEKLTALCKHYCQCIVKTKKGYHFWFQNTDKISHTLRSSKLGFDIPVKLFVPPSYYDIPEIGRAEYKFINKFNTEITDLSQLGLAPVPDEIVVEIKR